MRFNGVAYGKSLDIDKITG
jgi:Domain of unknown function (DUF4748)